MDLIFISALERLAAVLLWEGIMQSPPESTVSPELDT